MQMRKINREKGYCFAGPSQHTLVSFSLNDCTIIRYEVSQSVLLRCNRALNTFVNKFSNLSALVQCSDVLEFVLGRPRLTIR